MNSLELQTLKLNILMPAADSVRTLNRRGTKFKHTQLYQNLIQIQIMGSHCYCSTAAAYSIFRLVSYRQRV